ncbi:MAG: hypothetical protein KZQ92_23045 [Candidatus Thiodiazotropha sp. (ex Lucinoma borealis)]|nr:hypothetical protein [Candidatus Thiodiazotropha sp. (ex Lucinoma borealis)]MCU7855982.1 hypothetical protein [Candidatus Thiodiazotropha sp. (ex Lucinoma borealis)]MCU7866840.1 hypothetical protein [Candidatus Thiodiazotropha sp. (ex Lucinoma borealis)]MCU7868296.1 hypothetical protein [Candidatus Thiodiazotropha sp. (ex Lucinoma borealis)]
MGKKLPPQQMELYKRIDEILFYKWDPIGISDGGWARDEYQSYLPRVFSMALEYEKPEPIAEYLGVVTTESMGLSSAKEHDLAIAKEILEVKEALGI